MGEKRDEHGFSETALSGLQDLLRRTPPPDAQPVSARQGHHSRSSGLPHRSALSHRPHYWGHRERLRTRFLQGGAASMPEYELLEMILFNAIGRIDVKPLAKTLLETFGDLNGVMAASEHRLLQVEGTTPKVHYQLRLFAAVAERMGKAQIINRHVLTSWSQLMSYCTTVMAHRETEQFRTLFLDRKNVLIAD